MLRQAGDATLPQRLFMMASLHDPSASLGQTAQMPNCANGMSLPNSHSKESKGCRGRFASPVSVSRLIPHPYVVGRM